MKKDVEEAKKLTFISKLFVNGGTKEEFLKKVAVFIVF